jgi:Gram-negative bacterial TonB protein C-terminal
MLGSANSLPEDAMKIRRATPCILTLSLLAAVAAARAAKDDPAALNASLLKSAAASSLNTAGLKPWHMKISAQLFDWKGNGAGTGTIEEWWMAPGNEKRVFAFPDYQGTEIITSDGVWRSSGLASEPMLISIIVSQIVNPAVAQEKMTGGKPTTRSLQLGSVNLPCIMVAKPNSRVDDIPIGLYPSWCMEPGKAAIRSFVDDGGLAVVRNDISSFQDRDIPMSLSIGLNSVVLATAKVEDVSLEGMPSALFAPSSDLVKAEPKFTELKGKKFENLASHREEPDFSEIRQKPNPLTRGNNGLLQGDVEVRLWVGEDGQIRDLLLLSFPDSSAAQATLDAVRRWVFHPYAVNGHAVPYTGTLDFEINNTDYERQMRTAAAPPSPQG